MLSRTVCLAVAARLAILAPCGASAAAQAQPLREVAKTSDLAGGLVAELDDHDAFGAALAGFVQAGPGGAPGIAIGAPRDDAGGGPGAGAGAVWLLTLDATGNATSELRIGAGHGGFGGALDAHDRFGAALALLGPIGPGPLAVGAPGDDGGGNGSGALWLLDLAADGSVVSQHEIGARQGGFAGALDAHDAFGSALAVIAPNVLAVGAPGDDDGGNGQGAVWILFLDGGGGVASHVKISATEGGFGAALAPHDAFGSSLALLGPSLLAVGAPGDDDGGNGQGAVWLLSLDAHGGVVGQSKISATAGGFTGALAAHDAFGSAVVALGDLDGDGVGELGVGAPGDDDGGSNQGAAWLLFLRADGTVESHRKISALAGGFDGELDAHDAFGSALALLADLDGDGVTEIASGAPGDDDGGAGRGASWSLFPRGAVQELLLGSNINPQILQQGLSTPSLGGIWDPLLVISGDGKPLVNFLALSREPDMISAKALGIEGEILISIAPEDFLGCVFAAPGDRFEIQIPGNVDLVGEELYCQSAIVGPTGSIETLTNALAGEIGF